MKRYLLLCVISISFLTTNAQWVNIPDSNFGKWLKSNYSSCITGTPQTGFQMDTSCGGISNAHMVDCNTMLIADLTGIQYFKLLDTLYCYGNQLVSIPQLSPLLKYLDCSSNQLIVLPNIPKHATYLNFWNNHVSSLTTVPDSLIYLGCNSNQITSLPALPVGLLSLNCSKNQLSNLPALPPTLKNLTCSYNQITSIPILPGGLISLDCSFNQVNTLPNLPSTLTGLICSQNQLSLLPVLPSTLTTLECSHNLLTALPSLPSYLSYFSCEYNPYLLCFPQLKKIAVFRFDNTGITCLPNYPTGGTSSYPPLNSYPLCNLQSGCPVYWNISGNVHKDTSINCLLDSIVQGPRMKHLKVILAQSGIVKQQMYLNDYGEYSFNTDSFTNYQVSLANLGLPIQVKCPVLGFQTVALTSTDSIKGNVDFGTGCIGNDVGVNGIYGRFRPATNSYVLANVGDFSDLSCTGNANAVVTTQISGPALYISPALGALSPTSVVGNTLTYNIADVSAIQAGKDFNIIVQTDSNAALGAEVCITTTIHTPTPDYNPANDSLTMCFPVVNSFDPNDKTVYPNDISQNATWLNYTIQFQNTGTDTAYDIVVRDTLSSNLDLESFQYLASSHSPIVQVKGNVAVFTFANINLLDSFHNEPKSHGWLQYRIRTKPGLPMQSQIKNTAYIYFDLNAQVVTNTTVNTVNVTGINDINGIEPLLALYPNPASSVLHIGTNAMHPQWLTFYDASGRKVSEQAYTNTVDVSPLASGVYLLELKSSEGIVRRRFVR
jgi:uncharacterized repeat protein (TIGR01451 family)